MILTSFIGFLLMFFLVGISSYWVAKQTPSDYLVAGKSMSPSLVGLSAVATNNSGFMFIGMIGATYSMGLSSIWLMLGWILGDYLMQRKAVQQIQQVSQSDQVHSFGGLLSYWIGQQANGFSSDNAVFRLRRFIGIVTLLFLTVYAAAQLKAGTKATESLLGWSADFGILMAAVLIFIYSFVGGLRASIWTDVAQSIVMLAGMSLMVLFGWNAVTEEISIIQALQMVSPDYMNWFPGEFGIVSSLLFILGWVFGGSGVIGQPHIVIRFITLSPQHSAKSMQFYYYGWFIVFYGLTIAAGLLSRLLIPELSDFDAELALPMLAEKLMPEIFVGLLLAALFAATMSTVDSLILACSAALSRDFMKTPSDSIWVSKVSTSVVLVVAVWIAMSNNQTVFSLVLDAWGMLGSAFGPLILWLSLQRMVSVSQAFSAIIIGMLSFSVFTYGGFFSHIYALSFGFISGWLALWLMQKKPVKIEN